MPSVAVVGAGTMGSGIAQVAAMSGWTVELTDTSKSFVRAQLAKMRGQLDKLVEKGRLTADARDTTLGRLHFAVDAETLGGTDLVIEAIIENHDAKVAVLRPIVAAARPDTIFASNTSSLSISRLGDSLDIAPRMVGMHFFNPVPLLPLVEVIAGRESDPTLVTRVAEIARGWGKTVVRAKDTPGFIVNRVARGYYLESLRMLGEGVAGVDEIDATLKRLGGMRMGPFELMDMIGIDVNYSVSLSVWEQMGKPARLTPHDIQRGLFDKGQIGRKAGRGFYDYSGPTPLPAVVLPRQSFHMPPKLYEATRRFVSGATTIDGSQTEQYMFARVIATVINEGALLCDDGVATREDIDTALKLGANYPTGPLEWAERIGRHTTRAMLDALNATVTDNRFAAAEWLKA